MKQVNSEIEVQKFMLKPQESSHKLIEEGHAETDSL